MTTAPEPDRPSVLTRATDGAGDRGAFDVRTWRDEYGPRGEAGLWPAGVLVAAFVWQMFNGGPCRRSPRPLSSSSGRAARAGG